MSSLHYRSAGSWVRGNGMGRLRRSADRSRHGVMVSQCRGLRALWCTHVLLRRVRSAGRCGHRSIADALAGLVRRVVEKCTNVVHKQGVKKLCNLLLVREIQRAIKRYPASGQPSESKVGTSHAYQTPLRCIGPILTTCRVFSLLRIPSRRPRVMPATLRSLVPLIK